MNVTTNLAVVHTQAKYEAVLTVCSTVGICKSCQHGVLNVVMTSPETLCWACCRAEGRFQLIDGWKPFAQHWNLGHGEQLQLSRCFVIGGCIWLDVKIMHHSLSGAPVAISKHFKHAHVHIVSMTMLILRTCDLALTSSSVNSTLLATT